MTRVMATPGHLVLSFALLLPSLARADFFQSAASPGPLAPAHADLEGKCDKCHVPFKGIPNSSCLSCHTGTKQRIASGRGTHFEFERQGKKCSACHKDHRGKKTALTPQVEANFDHAVTGFVLVGRHAQATCASCHKPGPFGPKWVGLPTNCGGCHKDAHKDTLGRSCEICHSPSAWGAVKTLSQHKLPMTGAHKGLKCESCHKGGLHLFKESSCGDCHEQKHGGTKATCATCHNVNDWHSASFTHDFCTCILPGKHQTAPCLACHPKFKFTPTPFACAACHNKDRKHEDLGPCSQCHSALSWKTKTFDHNKPNVGFKIEGKHTEVGCENCHKQKGVFKGAPKNCEGCHKVPKHGDFGGCAQCHSVAGFDKPSFHHDKTAFPLDGKHAKVACETCHTKFKKGDFKRGQNECVLCHGNPHGTQFGVKQTSRAGFGILLASNGQHQVSAKFGCRDCHTTTAWVPSTIDRVRHAQLSGYELKGQHQKVACASCHSDGQFAGTPRQCAQCHVDRHRGKFAARACESCHTENGWKQVPGFDHFAATGFALDNSHARVKCAQCHGDSHEKLASVKTITCKTCHTPAHGDQFGDRCVECHRTTKFSDVPSFDHSRTNFPLDRRHRAVRCTSCHDMKRANKIDPFCRTCHGDPHRGRTLLECGECHRADRWTIVRFDHDRTEFPLRGRHFTAPCRDCHTNDQYMGVRAECVSCHRGDRVRADAAHADHRAFPVACAQCHTAFKW